MTQSRARSAPTRIRRLLGGALAVALALTAGGAPAQSPRPMKAPATKPVPVSAPAVAGADTAPGQPVALTLTKARQIRLPVDVRDVLVADPAVADVLIKTPRLAYMIGNKIGDTNAIFLDAQGRQVLKLDIRVDRDLTALRAAINDLAPDADVKVASLNQDLVVSGDVPSAQTADRVRQLVRHFVDKDENLVNMMRVTGAQQVLIRVKVAEVRRSVTKRLGFDLFVQGKMVTFQSGALNGLGLFADRYGTTSSLGRSGSTGYDIQGPQMFNNGYTLQGSQNPYTSWPGANTTSISVESLEQQGLIKVLAEPNLTSLSGEPANFLAGGEFPVPTARDRDGNITIEWKAFGVSLNFTPVVLATGRISLRLATEVSELTTEGQLVLAGLTIPGLSVRRAQTTVELPSGGALMVGGLLRNNARNTVRGLPMLKDLPVLGALFRSDDFLSDESEMVVIATPYVVRPGSPEAMKAPTDGFAPASDLDMYLLNGLYARYGAGSRPEGKGDRVAGGGATPEPAKAPGYIVP